ncbi:MAG TPA: GlsB/YeaQ/YmgE family stress response membrane protein [Isosphaeraceae bacterium]|jgi:uncharacterized membrane protein YeaQ/YmgE (transglycosylase-associated protein family)|nr:GlsB/YeaQ/YmgE family stress response membrane protein [Isosphaeraceae bacterium]
MWLIQYAIFGLVAGAIARLLHPGRDPMNWLWTMLLGVGGAVVGGFAARQLGINADSGLASCVAAVAGAIVLLVAYHMLTAPAARAVGAGGSATSDDYKRAVMDDLSRGPNG